MKALHARAPATVRRCAMGCAVASRARGRGSMPVWTKSSDQVGPHIRPRKHRVYLLAAEDVSQPERDDVLWHYTSPNGMLGIIASKSLWATNILYLNDVEEFYHVADLVEGAGAKFVQSEQEWLLVEAYGRTVRARP